jgi:hypothetical protein
VRLGDFYHHLSQAELPPARLAQQRFRGQTVRVA